MCLHGILLKEQVVLMANLCLWGANFRRIINERYALFESEQQNPIFITFLSCFTVYRLDNKTLPTPSFGLGILFPKLFLPIVRKNYSSDREKLLKFEAEGREFANFWDYLNNLFKQWKVSAISGKRMFFELVPGCFLNLKK